MSRRWSQVSPRWIRHSQIFSDGLVAGLFAGLAILAVFTIYDLWTAEAFRTPSVLYAYFWYGAEAARDATANVDHAIRYCSLHLVAWLFAGVIAAYAVAFSARTRGTGYGVTMAATIIVCTLVAVAAIPDIPGLGIDVLWTGATLGGLVIIVALTGRRLRSVPRDAKP